MPMSMLCFLPLCTRALDNGLALLPHRGWSSWNMFKCNGAKPSLADLNETVVRRTADAMVSLGFAAAGYEFVNLDDCYQAKQRDANGAIVGDPGRFPGGMKSLGDYIHAHKLKFGVYLDCGTLTCQGFPGSQGTEALDAATIAGWGADYLKYDECHSTARQEMRRFFDMRDALNHTRRPVLYVVCPIQSRCNGDPALGDFMWDASSVANGNMCRGDRYAGSRYCRHGTARGDGDILPTWNSFNCLVDANVAFGSRRFGGAGHWVLSDILEVGNGMTTAEDEAQFTLWCMFAWPLIMGHDLPASSADTVRILTHPELLAISGDAMGKAAWLVGADGGPAAAAAAIAARQQVYVRQLAGGDWAVALYNRDDNASAPVTLHWRDIALLPEQPALLRDLWRGNSSVVGNGAFTAVVPSHAVVALRITQQPLACAPVTAEAMACACPAAGGGTAPPPALLWSFYANDSSLRADSAAAAMCLDVADCNKDGRGVVDFFTCRTALPPHSCNPQNQQWSINANGTVTSAMDGSCLTLPATATDGSECRKVLMRPCNGSAAQRWAWQSGSSAAAAPGGGRLLQSAGVPALCLSA
jgi:alpha-galactosidase